MLRVPLLVLGWTALLLGMVGVFLPVVPTVPFLLVAVWCFGRSSPRLKAAIMRNETLGPPLRRWFERGAVSRPAKMLSSGAMAAGFAAAALLGVAPVVLAMQGTVCLAVAIYIWTRPDR